MSNKTLRFFRSRVHILRIVFQALHGLVDNAHDDSLVITESFELSTDGHTTPKHPTTLTRVVHHKILDPVIVRDRCVLVQALQDLEEVPGQTEVELVLALGVHHR